MKSLICGAVAVLALAGSAVTLASGVEMPAKLSLHQVGKLPFGGDATDTARTVYLPIAGHAVSAPLDSGAIYRVDSDDASAWIVAADAHHVDSIALSTHGRGTVKRFVLGSVADEIIRHAKVPVLVHRPDLVGGLHTADAHAVGIP